MMAMATLKPRASGFGIWFISFLLSNTKHLVKNAIVSVSLSFACLALYAPGYNSASCVIKAKYLKKKA